jgi:hypothetical protein
LAVPWARQIAFDPALAPGQTDFETAALFCPQRRGPAANQPPVDAHIAELVVGDDRYLLT